MLPPITIPIPSGTHTFCLTALSLSSLPSTASVSWTDGSATFGADFVGPSETYVLGDKVFGSPIITATPLSSEVSVSFNFKDTMTQQHSLSAPITKKVGPEGSSTSVQISGYAASDKNRQKPNYNYDGFSRQLARLRPQS
jgi:hypothetical protein